MLRLQNSGNASVERAGSLLNDLRRTRVFADYNLLRSFAKVSAVGSVQDADAMIQLLDAVVEPTRIQVMGTMKDYERLVLRDVTWHP